MSTEMSREQVKIILKKFKENLDEIDYRMYNGRITQLDLGLKTSIMRLEYDNKGMDVRVFKNGERDCESYIYWFTLEQFSPTYLKIRSMCRKIEMKEKALEKENKKKSSKEHLRKLDEYLIETFPEELEKNLLE